MRIAGITLLAISIFTVSLSSLSTLQGQTTEAATDAAATPPTPDQVGGPLPCPPKKLLQERIKPLSAIRVGIQPKGDMLPEDCSAELFTDRFAASSAPSLPGGLTTFSWAPSNLAHEPLYFDDVPLENYGQTRHPLFQPVISGARFFGTLPVIPYKIGVDRLHDPVYTLGTYRPGSPGPCVHQGLPHPLELDASLLEAGTIVGLLLLLP